MNDFLHKSLEWKNQNNLCIILGNESCDLDSAVSSICLAYFYNENRSLFDKNYNWFLSVLNVERDEFPLKTEVNYFLKENKIDTNNLIFLDDLDDPFFKENDIILVDHHVSPYSSSVIEVIDHRPYDTKANLNVDCKKHIDLVGSCCTLIAFKILSSDNHENYKEILNLLRVPIIVDTINFSLEANKARDLDIKVINNIEDILNTQNNEIERQIIFDSLLKARTDISLLNSYQLLLKDSKILPTSIKIAIPGFPILVQEYITLENAQKSIEKFADTKKCAIILLMGMKITNGRTERDLGLITISSNQDLFNEILNSLLNEKDIRLDQIECNFMNGVFFKQNNIEISRKQILPIVKKIVDTYTLN